MRVIGLTSMSLVLFMVSQPVSETCEASSGPPAAAPVTLVGMEPESRDSGKETEQSPESQPVQTEEESVADDLEAIRRAAQAEAEEEEAEEEETETTTFTSGALGLQALNPEISVTGDFLLRYQLGSDASVRFRTDVRTLGIHFESYLDPRSKFKAAVPITLVSAFQGEAYFTRFGLLPSLNLTLGKFRQQFGVVNRWHKHGLDQVDFPLPIRQVFGAGGLNQAGFSFDWLMPSLGPATQNTTFQLTNGSNPGVFAQNTKNFPSFLIHYRNYRDLSKDTYLELGLTGLAGRNDTWPVIDQIGGVDTQTRDLWTAVVGADLSVLWEPTGRMRYRNWVWRTEAYFLRKDILAPDGSGESSIEAWGAYSYFQTLVSRTLQMGLRIDYYRPDTQPYAKIGDLSLAPLAVTIPDPEQWLLVPYLTWYPSPWVHWRLEWDHQINTNLGPDEDTLWLQCVWAAGPHKHERY